VRTWYCHQSNSVYVHMCEVVEGEQRNKGRGGVGGEGTGAIVKASLVFITGHQRVGEDRI